MNNEYSTARPKCLFVKDAKNGIIYDRNINAHRMGYKRYPQVFSNNGFQWGSDISETCLDCFATFYYEYDHTRDKATCYETHEDIWGFDEQKVRFLIEFCHKTLKAGRSLHTKVAHYYQGVEVEKKLPISTVEQVEEVEPGVRYLPKPPCMYLKNSKDHNMFKPLPDVLPSEFTSATAQATCMDCFTTVFLQLHEKEMNGQKRFENWCPREHIYKWKIYEPEDEQKCLSALEKYRERVRFGMPIF